MGGTRKERPYTVEVRTLSYTSVDVTVSAGSVKEALEVAAKQHSGDNIKLVIKDAPKNRKRGEPKPEKVPGKRGPKPKVKPESVAAVVAEATALVEASAPETSSEAPVSAIA